MKTIAEAYPELVEHWGEQNIVSPYEVFQGYPKAILWKCKEGHEYPLDILAFRKGRGCSYCRDISPKVLKGFNDLESKYPKLAKEYSQSNIKKAHEVYYRQKKYVLWTCKAHSHEYENSIPNRAQRGQACYFCSGNRVLEGFNDLASQYPQLAEEFSAKNIFKATEIVAGSGKSVVWECAVCSFEWTAKAYTRTKLNAGCPSCGSRRQVESIKETLLKKFGSFGDNHPELIKEWSDENKEDPYRIPNNYRDSILTWVCSKCGEKHAKFLANKIYAGLLCSKCNPRPLRSKGEMEVFDLIFSWYPDAMPNDRKILEGKEIDIFVPSLKKGVEYDGKYWHSDKVLLKRCGLTKEQFRNQKVELARKKGVLLLFLDEVDWKSNQAQCVKKILDFLG